MNASHRFDHGNMGQKHIYFVCLKMSYKMRVLFIGVKLVLF